VLSAICEKHRFSWRPHFVQANTGKDQKQQSQGLTGLECRGVRKKSKASAKNGEDAGPARDYRVFRKVFMSNKFQSEVLVAGAGPVGMLTALFLTQNGIKTRIIDQESRTAGHSYSCALHPHSLHLLRQAGLAFDAIDQGRRIDTVGFYEGNERRAEARLSELPVEFPFALVLEQRVLENLLEQKLRQAGVTVNWDHRLANLEMDDQGATAAIEQLGMTGKGYMVPDFEAGVKKNLQARAEFIVGADGSNSLVRERLGIRFENTGAPQHFAVYEVEAGGVGGHEARVVLDHTTAVLWPLSDTRCRWSFQINQSKEKDDFPQKERDRLIVVEPPGEQDGLHQLRRLLNDHAPWFQDPVQEVVWAADVQFEPRLARQFGRNVCWLAGDAAHQTGPVGMQSMNIGFREAADLADILTQILHQGASRDLLRSYNRVHRSHWNQLLGFKPGGPSTHKASEWVRRRAFRIVGSIPASGAELTSLLKQLGIELQPVPSTENVPA
jgi:2-polyprenyl-6-methoxyphenol hydroxylase-like FAD-dependent oxidoreductase